MFQHIAKCSSNCFIPIRASFESLLLCQLSYDRIYNVQQKIDNLAGWPHCPDSVFFKICRPTGFRGLYHLMTGTLVGGMMCLLALDNLIQKWLKLSRETSSPLQCANYMIVISKIIQEIHCRHFTCTS